MPDEKAKKILTIFKLSNQLKHQAQEEAKKRNISFSELLSTKVDEVLNLKTPPEIPKLKKGKISLITTSVLVPEGVHKAARHLSIEYRVSLADIFRFCLSNK
jgi:hypothetical protein